MTLDDVIKLAGAGFTKEQIMNLAQVPQTEPAPVVQTQQASPAPHGTIQPSPTAMNMATTGMDPSQQMQSIFDNFIQQMQSTNVAQLNQSMSTADDVLAAMINPVTKKEV